jgi:hypothetical protein
MSHIATIYFYYVRNRCSHCPNNFLGDRFMKYFAVSMLAFALSSIPSLANEPGQWQCDGNMVEGAGVSTARGQIEGNVSWDCWPGGGICSENEVVTSEKDENGDLVYRGAHFYLIVRTSEAQAEDGYKGHLNAKDMKDPADMGKGFVFDDNVTCKAAD